MFRSLRRAVVAARAAALLALAPAALREEAAAAALAADSLAFPRQFVQWVLTSQGDSAFAHAGPQLRESMKSAQGVNDMAGRVAARFGAVQGTDAEVQFDEGPLKVYITALRFATAPEPGAWVVVYSPATRVVERASFGPLSNIRQRYPQAKLP
ncbi:hypothetical protein [Roseisolibacter sp. H3M3-2]|uniref:hypothetical protein n=1 Tax=Roseisolibacter sp. H3M3-2 TaxID=3031323 RepID=UPI0023DCAD4F|nr:hypothetical protein [Roseisolibacter sp. H3M3-2]MDF1503915.1 hypothetical protein [Roseisolibacter sp. H3M3-2]